MSDDERQLSPKGQQLFDDLRDVENRVWRTVEAYDAHRELWRSRGQAASEALQAMFRLRDYVIELEQAA